MSSSNAAEIKNFKLLGHDPSAGWGGGSLVEIIDGFAYVGAIGSSGFDGREGFTVHDVRDPCNPKKVAEILAPPGVHNHKVRIVDNNYLYVNSERLHNEEGKNARSGFFIFDISERDNPRQVGFYDLPGDGPHRFGVDNRNKLAFFPNHADGWNGRVIWTLDISNPLEPSVISIWGLPEQNIEEHPEFVQSEDMNKVITCHGPPVIKGNEMYCGFWGGGMAIADVSDLTKPKLISNLSWSPPFVGATHTVWPFEDRPFVIVTDEGRSAENFMDSQFMWVMDVREVTNPIPIATYMPDRSKYYNRGKRFGAHNIIENLSSVGRWPNLVFLTYFNAGLRVLDLSDPFSPTEVGYFVPECNFGEDCVQSNDIGSDEDGRLYLIDRHGGGMHILEYTG